MWRRCVMCLMVVTALWIQNHYTIHIIYIYNPSQCGRMDENFDCNQTKRVWYTHDQGKKHCLYADIFRFILYFAIDYYHLLISYFFHFTILWMELDEGMNNLPSYANFFFFFNSIKFLLINGKILLLPRSSFTVQVFFKQVKKW